MNMQAMLKKAQTIQKEMMEEQKKIEDKEFIGKSSIVTVVAKGNKEIIKVTIDSEKMDADEIEMLEDMIVVAVNDCMHQIEKELEEKLGKYTKGLPGLF